MGLLFPPVPELGVLTVGLLAVQLASAAINKMIIVFFISAFFSLRVYGQPTEPHDA